MTDWRKVKAPEGGRHGLVEPVKHYALKPGMAVVYNEDSIHSPDRAGPTRLIRIEGRNLDGVTRDRYQPADKSDARSEEHTSELQSLMRISYAVFCLKKKKKE